MELDIIVHKANVLTYIWSRDSKMGLLAQTTTFCPLLSCANAVYEN